MTAAIPSDLTASVLPQPRKRRIPSDRNRRVWVEVVLTGRPQPEVAKEFGITQQRVSQIVDQFQLWLAENLPPGLEGISAEGQMRLVVNTAYLREEHLFANAMRKLDQSFEDKHSLRIRYSAQGEELWRETLRENQTGKSGYLGVALNAATRQVRLVQMAAGLLGPALEVDWHHGDSASREPDRFRCERSERIVHPAASTACQAAETAPTDELRKPLCDSAPIDSPASPLAAAPVAASPAAVAACREDVERKSTSQENAELFSKPCATACEDGVSAEPLAERADHMSPLCESATPVCEQASLTIATAAGNDPPAATCEITAPRNQATQEPRKLFANSCERLGSCGSRSEPRPGLPSMSPPATSVDGSRGEPLLSADERRRRKRQRQKQLARWRASRQCVPG